MSRRQIIEPAVREAIQHYRESSDLALADGIEHAWERHDYRALRDLHLITASTCDALEAGEAGAEPASD